MYHQHKLWIHAEYDLAKMRQASVPSVTKASSSNRVLPSSPPKSGSFRRSESYRVPYLTIFLAFLVGFVFAFTYQWHLLSDYPEIYDFETVARDTIRLADRDDVLSRLNADRKRKLAAEVHYVINLIQANSSKKGRLNPKDLAQSIVFEAKKANYDPLLVTAVIKSESTFNHRAVSPVGAKGLMQIMPATGKFVSQTQGFHWAGEHKLQDPQYNLRLGIAYLKQLEQAFRGNRELALIAYNWGPANVQKALKERGRMPTSSVRYARTIMGNHQRWKRDYTQRLQTIAAQVDETLGMLQTT